MSLPNNTTNLASVAVDLFTWFWDKYGHDMVAGVVKNAWSRFDWALGARRYAQKINELYGLMRILGKNEPVAVSDIYTSLSILDRFTTQMRFRPELLNNELWQRKSPQHSINRFDGMEVVKKESYLFILGRPGAGKSTFLRHVILEAVDGKIPNYLPVMVELRDFAFGEKSVFDYLIEQFDVCNFPDAKEFLEKMLANGRLLILFDGLDEVPTEQDRMWLVMRDVETFVKQYSKCKYVITCRIAATDFRFSQFTYVELAEFTNSQAHEFTNKWFQNKNRFRASFWRDMEESGNAGLLEMTRNPLLLTLLCLNYEVSQSFPTRRVEIYEEALDALLKTWDAERGIQRTGTKLSSYGKLSLGYKKEMFAELAATGFEEGQLVWLESELAESLSRYVASIPPEQNSRIIDGYQILKDIEAQHAILIEQVNGQYSFAHLTFQEYYTASYIVTSGQQSYQALVRKHMYDSRWREVFLLVASKLSRMQADNFFETYTSYLRKLISKSNALLKWVSWIENRCAGSYKNDYDALGARVILAICSLQFTREKSVFESSSLDLFCKIWNIPTSEDYLSLFTRSYVPRRLMKNNPALEFDWLLFSLYRTVWDRMGMLSNSGSNKQYYQLITSLVNNIINLLPKQQEDYSDHFEEMAKLTNASEFAALGDRIEHFLYEVRGWKRLDLLDTSDYAVVKKYLDSTMQCIECLELSRVSNRSKLYRELLARGGHERKKKH